MSLLARFLGPPKPRDPVAAARIRQWVRERLDDDAAGQEAIAVTVSEIVCTDAACPGTETVILIMRARQKTRALKLSKPIDEIDERAIDEAMTSA